MRTTWLWLALGGAGILYLLTRTQRGEVAAVDAVEFVTVNAQRIADESWRVTRGLRNRNPGNIDWIANPLSRWRGMVSKEEGGRFGIFASDADGVRAIGKELLRAASRGARTVDHLIAGIPQADGSRYDAWAPSNENDSGAYTKAVAKRVGVDPYAPINVHAELPAIAAGIIQVENGVQPYALRDVEQWVYS